MTADFGPLWKTHWVASPVPYPFLHEISYWKTWKFIYINTYQTFAIWYKIFAIENLFFNSDAKYLQLKIYFSIQMQKNCKLVIGIQDFAKNYAKKLQTFCKIRVETQNINKWILIEILLQKHCISIKDICILQRFSPQCSLIYCVENESNPTSEVQNIKNRVFQYAPFANGSFPNGDNSCLWA